MVQTNINTIKNDSKISLIAFLASLPTSDVARIFECEENALVGRDTKCSGCWITERRGESIIDQFNPLSVISM
jgi:hypothetical protein